MFTNTSEAGLESLIVKWLVEQNHYEQGQSRDYNTEYALDTVRLFLFLKDTQPDNVEELQLETNPQKKAQFLNLRPFSPEPPFAPHRSCPFSLLTSSVSTPKIQSTLALTVKSSFISFRTL